MNLRLLWLGALASALLGLYTASTLQKGGGIDPNGEPCEPGSGTSVSPDYGSSMDPDG